MERKLLVSWLLLASALGTTQLRPRVDLTGHTYLPSRGQRWLVGDLIDAPQRAAHGRARRIQARFVWNQSFGAWQAERYFGEGSGPGILVGYDPHQAPPHHLADVYHHDLINNVDARGEERVSLRPEEQISGVILGGDLALPCRWRGELVAGVALPLVRVERRLNPSWQSLSGESLLESFFTGSAVTPEQRPLTNGKFYHGHQSAGGLGNAEFSLSAAFPLESPGERWYVTGALVMPSAGRPRGDYLYEPLVGNGGHPGIRLSLGVEKNKHLDDTTITYRWGFSYEHLCTANQRRLVGLRGVAWGHYSLLGDSSAPNLQLVPAANVLTLPCKVQPGDLWTMGVEASLYGDRWSISGSYNLRVIEGERLDPRELPEAGRYGAAFPGYEPLRNHFGQNVNDFRSGLLGDFLTIKSLNFGVASAPMAVVHAARVSCRHSFPFPKATVFLELFGGIGFCSTNVVQNSWEMGINTAFSV